MTEFGALSRVLGHPLFGLALTIAVYAVGSIAAPVTALTVPVVSGAPQEIVASIAPRSATTAVAVGISEPLGGLPGLTAVIVICSGLCGAIAGPALLARSGITDDRASGFALDLASHAIGTARAFQMSERAGAFASIGMILNALLTALPAPSALALVRQWRDARGADPEDLRRRAGAGGLPDQLRDPGSAFQARTFPGQESIAGLGLGENWSHDFDRNLYERAPPDIWRSGRQQVDPPSQGGAANPTLRQKGMHAGRRDRT